MEAQILVQLPPSARTDADRFQFRGERRKKLLSIFGAVRTMELPTTFTGLNDLVRPIPYTSARTWG